MVNIKYTLNENGYVNNFVKIGDLEGSKITDIDNFNELHFDCYKEVEGNLVFDEQKLQEKLNPPQELSEIEKLRLEIAKSNTEMFEVVLSLLGGM